MNNKTLYERLGGYDAISAVANNLLPRLQADPQLARYWQHRGEDGVNREKQLLIDFLCSSAGGPLYYTGRDMKTSHKGMKISESDWSAFLGHVNATLEAFQVPQPERDQVVAFVQSTKPDIVEAQIRSRPITIVSLRPIVDRRRRRANGLEAVVGLGFRKAMGLFAVTKGLGQSDYANDFVESHPERMSTRHLVDVRLKRLGTVYRHPSGGTCLATLTTWPTELDVCSMTVTRLGMTRQTTNSSPW